MDPDGRSDGVVCDFIHSQDMNIPTSICAVEYAATESVTTASQSFPPPPLSEETLNDAPPSEELTEDQALQLYYFARQEEEEEEEEEYELAADDLMDEGEDECRRQWMQRQRKEARRGVFDKPISLEQLRTVSFMSTPKSRHHWGTILSTLRHHLLFSFMPEPDRRKIAGIVNLATYVRGDTILTTGAPNDTLFIVLEGQAAAVHCEADLLPASLCPAQTALTTGATFGDEGLMYETCSDCTVRVCSDFLQCAMLDRQTYKLFTTRVLDTREGYAVVSKVDEATDNPD